MAGFYSGEKERTKNMLKTRKRLVFAFLAIHTAAAALFFCLPSILNSFLPSSAIRFSPVPSTSPFTHHRSLAEYFMKKSSQLSSRWGRSRIYYSNRSCLDQSRVDLLVRRRINYASWPLQPQPFLCDSGGVEAVAAAAAAATWADLGSHRLAARGRCTSL